MSKKRIKRFGVFQTAKIAGIMYFILIAICILPFTLISSPFPTIGMYPMPMFPKAFFLWLPFIYGIFGFITTAIGCAFYNMVAKFFGGIEVEIDTE